MLENIWLIIVFIAVIFGVLGSYYYFEVYQKDKDAGKDTTKELKK